MKNKKYKNARTNPKSNIEIVERDNDRSLFWLGASTSLKSGG